MSAPRSGSTLLFSLLSQARGTWTIGGESHGVFAQFPQLAACNAAPASGRLVAAHAGDDTAAAFRLVYIALLKNRHDRPLHGALLFGDRPTVTFLEKTPRNSLNIPFLVEVFPRARFIFLHRDPRENISSIMEGWQVGGESGRFVTFPDLPDWPLGYWCFLLPPGWQELSNRPVEEIAAFQWQACNEIILDDLERFPANRWTTVTYADLIGHPARELGRLCTFCGVETDQFLASRTSDNLPLSATTVSPPRPHKWRRHESKIMPLLPALKTTIDRLGELTP